LCDRLFTYDKTKQQEEDGGVSHMKWFETQTSCDCNPIQNGN